jgi:hypothetical protein
MAMWGDVLEGDPAALLSKAENPAEEGASPMRDAQAFLREALSSGPRDVTEVLRMATERGIRTNPGARKEIAGRCI